MLGLRLALAGMWLALGVYTVRVVSAEGLGLLPVFFGQIGGMGWPGQFNLDFLCFLVLSALWTAWRSRFTAGGVFLAVVAFFGGAGFLLPYLLYLTLRERGAMEKVLLGSRS